jgi:hypothetical protein
MNDQDHSLSLSDPDRSLVLSHLLVNFLINLASCQTGFIRTFPAKFLLPTFKNHFCDLAYFYNRDKQFN